MPIGSSGRAVVEIDPVLKRQLYAALALDQSTLKDWFRSSVEAFLAEGNGIGRQTESSGDRRVTR
jgi:hypothetical protein